MKWDAAREILRTRGFEGEALLVRDVTPHGMRSQQNVFVWGEARVVRVNVGGARAEVVVACEMKAAGGRELPSD